MPAIGNLEQFKLDYEGFGQANTEMMELLSKALTAGSGVDAASYTGGRALIPESLDNVLVNILHTQDEAKIFQMLKKNPIKSPVHQWDDRTEVGADDGGWVPEAGNSVEANQTIARRYGTAKYLQTLRKVSLQASISNMIENAMALEQNAGTLWLIRNMEKALVYGNKDYVSYQPDGLISLIPSTNVLDVRGGNASSDTFENKMEEGARLIRDNYGKGDNFFCSTKVMQDVQRLLRDRIRFEAGPDGLGSRVFSQYPTPFGTFKLHDDIFIQEGVVPAKSSITASVPDAPTETDAQAGDALSEFAAGDAGNYYYKIVPINEYGQGDALSWGPDTISAGDKNTIAVTKGSTTPTAYQLYRSKKGAANGNDCRYMFTTKYTASPMDVIDYNSFLPGCSDAFLLTMAPLYNAIEFEQFLPMMKFDLYPTNAAVYPFLMLLFGFLALKKAVQHVRIKNVAPSDLDWF